MPNPEGARPHRRQVLAGLCATVVLGLAGVRPAHAFGGPEARTLVTSLVDDINRIINSGQSEQQMFRQFEQIFATYADVPTIARSALGPPARSASAAQMREFTEAFRGYIARKYGRRFREFIGGRIEVNDVQPLRSYFEVYSTARLRGQSPFDVRWHVSDRGGRPMFFNIIIEGVNMLAAERTEIGAMLDRRGGNIDALINDLRSA
jgi:phospholipid transport system substrate-binding protein